MNKLKNLIAASLLATAVISAPTPAQADPLPVAMQTETIQSPWVKTDTVAMQVSKLQTVTRWEDLGKFIRVGPDAKRQLADFRKNIDSREYKVVLVHMQMKNISNKNLELGRDFAHGGTWNRIFLKSEDGSIRHTKDHFKVSQDHSDQAGSRLTHYLSGGYPLKAKVAPGATISGRLAFVVPEWFEPATLYTENSKKDSWGNIGGYGSSGMSIKL